MRTIADFGPPIVPSDVYFMHIVQKFDATPLGQAAKIAWL
jgi:hypothetical protein